MHSESRRTNYLKVWRPCRAPSSFTNGRRPAQTEYIFKHALIDDVAYKSVLQERRKAIHGKTAETIEKLYANRLDDHLDKLVHHYRLSGNGPKTVHYLHQAEQHAYERSAVADALTHFNAALETVRQLPSDGAVTELELALQISLGNSLMSTGGYAAEGTAKAFERARELCGKEGDSSQLVPALFGLWAFHNFGGKLKAAQELGEELLSIAERRQDPATLLMAHTSLGITLTYSGELRGALEHCTKGVSVFSPAERLPAFLAQARSSCRTWLALILALTGRPEPAFRLSNEAVNAALESRQTVALSNALIGAGVVALVLADSVVAKARSEELIGLAERERFVLHLSWGEFSMVTRWRSKARQIRASRRCLKVSQLCTPRTLSPRSRKAIAGYRRATWLQAGRRTRAKHSRMVSRRWRTRENECLKPSCRGSEVRSR
jgi:tetratricopeptide (TPR) repeat protein